MVESIIEGTNIIVDATNPANPIVGVANGYAYGGTVYYTSSGTFDKGDYPGLRAIIVEAVGGGGAGETTGYAELASAGRGGGGAEYARSFILASNLAASEVVTVGAAGEPNASPGAGGDGGESSFGSHVVASPGQGATGSGSTGGNGGSGGVGDLLIPGGQGDPGFQAGREISGRGGGSVLGHPGAGRRGNFNSTGADAAGYGAGGGGATSLAGVVRLGGWGAPGIVIVHLYY